MIHQISIGKVRVTVLGIATAERSAEEIAQLFPEVDPSVVAVEAGPGLAWSFNPLLVRFADRVVLVDTGFGFAAGGPGVAIRDILVECGVSAEDVTSVVITHCHGDHIGGLLHDGAAAFPRAELVIAETERSYWLGSEADASRSAPVRLALAAYERRVRTFAPGAALFDEQHALISALDLPGHTPGHAGLAIVSAGSRLLALVDTLHAEPQFRHPDWSPRFDSDPRLAAQTRERTLASVADTDLLVSFYHLPFPGIGRVRHAGDEYAWSPIGS